MHTFAEKPKATQQTTSAKSTKLGRGHLAQSPEVKSILHSQGAIENQAVQRMLQTDAEKPEADLTRPASLRFEHDFSRIPTHPPAAAVIQTKLAMNELGDSYEQDADRMAEQVMRTPEPQLQRACPCGGGCPKCHTEEPSREHTSLQTKRVQASDTGQIAAPSIVHEVLRSPGQPLDPATRAFMEPRFGYDFSRVRVHSGATAEQSAQDVNAKAYTVGHTIVFAAGLFAPGTHAGRRLLAHELTHVVQQSGSDAVRIDQRGEKRGLPPISPHVHIGSKALQMKQGTGPRNNPQSTIRLGFPRPWKEEPPTPEQTSETQYPNDVALASPLRGFKPPNDTLFTLLDFSGKHLWLERLNEQGEGVLAEMAWLLKLDLDWNTNVETVRKHHLTGGAALKQVEGAAKTIGERAREEGQGKSYREDVEGYLDAIRAADKQVREIGAMRAALDIAVSEMHTVALGGKKLQALRDVGKKQADLDAEQKRINDQKALIAKFTGFAVSLVNPKEWTTIIVAAAVCVGESVLEANVPAGSIERLQQQLTEAKARLVGIEDAEQLSKMVTAAQKISAASQNLSSAKQNFLDFFKNIEMKQTTIVETLGGRSATKGAARAIAERGEVAAAAIRAEQRITRYLDESATFPSRVTPLADRYRAAPAVYVDRRSPFTEGLPKDLSPDHIRHLMDVSTHNANTLDEYKRYIEQMRVDAKKNLEYLAAGEYMAGYSDIKGALENALIERNAPKQQGGRTPSHVE